MRLQPVLPIHVDQDWNVITRLYMPIVEQQDVTPTYGTEYGIVGSNLSFFLSPRTSASQDLTIGLGPVVGFPATNAALGSQKWGLGPTAAIVWQPPGRGPSACSRATSGRSAADADEADINETYLQPFISYTTKDAWTLGANCECTYYWTDDEGSAPINLSPHQAHPPRRHGAEPRPRRALLGREPRQRRARLGRPLRGDAGLPRRVTRSAYARLSL